MENYDDLVMKNQSGVIDDLDFLLEQEGLAEIYLEGMPELESTQAARRSLEKRGISWTECKEIIEAEKTERDSETKDFTLAFKAALAAAISGTFQPLVELKRKGFFPSISDIELLKDIAPQARTAVETIFQIKIDNLHFSKLAESDNKQEVKQLSLNF